jgi:FRG domain
MGEIRRIPYSSWEQFKAELLPTLFSSGQFEEEKYVFRGAGDAEWKLASSFDRYAANLPVGQRATQAERLLKMFCEECDEDGAIAPCPPEDEKRLAVAQHFGLPTRALDWTDSPYIASHFAFADVQLGAGSGQVAVWALSLAHEAWQDQGATVMRISDRENERMLRQRGVLTYLRAPYDTLEEHVEACDEGEESALIQFRLPRSEAPAALADLRAMGIASTRLFPDRTGAARAARARCFG